MKKFVPMFVIAGALISEFGFADQLGRVDESYRAEVLNCDDGAAKVLVNIFDKRSLHFVISDRAIMEYFRDATEFELLDGRGNRGPGDFYGRSNDPVESAATFGGFIGEKRQGTSGEYILQNRVYRNGTGIKIELLRDYIVSNGEGGATNRLPLREVANWQFQNCQPAAKD